LGATYRMQNEVYNPNLQNVAGDTIPPIYAPSHQVKEK